MNDIINKIKNLLNKTTENGCTVEEAASAIALAQKLISRHNLSMMDIETAEEEVIANFGAVPGSEGQRISTWKSALANVLANNNSCRVYIHSFRDMNRGLHQQINIIGRDSDVQIVNYMFHYISREIERMCKIAIVVNNGEGKTWTNNFKIGAVSAIDEKLKQVKTEVRSEAVGTALIRLDQRDKAVELFMNKSLNLKAKAPIKYRGDADAFNSGYEAGSKIQANVGLNAGKVKYLGSGG